jgi:hypothetical protein
MTRALLLLLLTVAFLPTPVAAQRFYITPGWKPPPRPPSPVSLGCLVRESTSITLLEVERLDRERAAIHFKVARTLRGTALSEGVTHDLSPFKYVLPELFRWAQVGKKAVVFARPSATDVCLGNYWYRVKEEGRGEQVLLQFRRTYTGTVDELQKAVEDLLAGREVVLTAEAGGGFDLLVGLAQESARDWVRGQKGRVWRIRTDPRATPDQTPEVVGMGLGGPERVPGFLAALKSADPHARCEAAADLARLGPLARDAVPGLHEALRDADRFVRVQAA